MRLVELIQDGPRIVDANTGDCLFVATFPNGEPMTEEDAADIRNEEIVNVRRTLLQKFIRIKDNDIS